MHTPRLLPSVRAALAENSSRWQEIADATGVSLSAIRKIRYGEVSDPSVNAVEKVAVYLFGATVINCPRLNTAA